MVSNHTVFQEFIVKQPLGHEVSLHLLVVEADDVADLHSVQVFGGRLVLPVDGEARLLHGEVQLVAGGEKNTEINLQAQFKRNLSINLYLIQTHLKWNIHTERERERERERGLYVCVCMLLYFFSKIMIKQN